jgi:hypothetical protein
LFNGLLHSYIVLFDVISTALTAYISTNIYWYVQVRKSRDSGVDGRIILKWIFRKWDIGVWTGLGWFRIETGGGHL